MDYYFLDQFELGKTYIVAVSGGVDSVVLLDKISRVDGIKVIVAHFDHQIRGQSSADDAELVRQLAAKYNYKYEIMRGGLGPTASEEEAREARYRFLRSVASDHQGRLVVAHHFDDVIESIAINIERGTGWQGLAVMDAPDVLRPLINWTKDQIIQYAKANNLKWNEDETNSSDKYLRNRLRYKIKQEVPFENRLILFECFWRQRALKRAILSEARRFYNSKGQYRRYFWVMLDYRLAVELFRLIVKFQFQLSITTPQAEQALIAIKTSKKGATYQVGEGVYLEFSLKNFVLKRK